MFSRWGSILLASLEPNRLNQKHQALSVASQLVRLETLVPRRDQMSNPKEQVRIQLTPEQKAQVKGATNKDAEAIELTATELEERIAPIMYS